MTTHTGQKTPWDQSIWEKAKGIRHYYFKYMVYVFANETTEVYIASYFKRSSSTSPQGHFFWLHVVFYVKVLHCCAQLCLQLCLLFSLRSKQAFLSYLEKVLVWNTKLLSCILFNLDVLQILERNIANSVASPFIPF